MNKNNKIHDVAIVGYGPVGQTLAILLGRMGYSVAVYERWQSLYPLPRAVFHDHEIRRVFRMMGLEDELQHISQPSACYQWFNADWKVLVEIDWSAESISDGPFGYLFNQPALEAALDRKAKAIANVEVHQGWEVLELSQDDQLCTLRMQRTPRDGQAQQGEERQVRARFVIGADGANSLVRRQCGIEWQDLGFEEDWLVVDLQPKPGVELDVPDIGQWCNPARPTTMVPGGPGYRRWEFMRLPHESMEDLQDLDKVWALLSPWVTPDTATLVRHAVYQFRSKIAHTWRHGRVLLAGDAAHLMPPFMGQGMCSGIRDAWNLSWRLDLVFKGLCSEQLLDSYTLERKPQIRAVIDASVEMGKVVCVADPQKAAERDVAFLSGDVPPLPPFPGLNDGAVFKDPRNGRALELAGSLGVHGQIVHDGRQQRFDDAFGRGFHLLSIDSDPLAGLNPAHKALLEHLQVTVVRLSENGAAGTCLDVSGKYHAFLRESGVRTVLVRPDFYIYGGVDDIGELPHLLDAFQRDLKVQNVRGEPQQLNQPLAAQR
ncbi:MAG: bifunctional 3-(3-hydroxy-phenyl)propionate/3-hydroxycinnamic acid hydroxylase [Candidatus Pseudomonas phytovorans]|uniref:Bifunctional 3-(3-hydroxy-phenyl)propionate/3-hydroxycinnamic acid hydroxylase n=1 Tax=Candidatus Pseudomonas phytovorans TaxID=3121377 RepID=A0AAJ5WE91_9PSED|nr:bifunctional 3-(3-hydroxy-phenyl)propionate/3-hydroxycinnamic acid hydroxylase [Pseudomonas sp.]WEK28838.1 MAG: bifunctional 3-(3-hydroxy-phenyl)propionate/3-hydroxycinnamic acid hydroxylase [Pseudomonas sp.]